MLNRFALIRSLGMIALLTFATGGLAQDDDNKDKELLPGDEGYPVKTTPPLTYGNATADDALFLGAGLGFGQARTTESDSSAGLAFTGQVEIGFQKRRGNWNRFEAGLALMSGKAGFRVEKEAGGKVDMPIGFGLLARLGLGHSLGHKFYGVYKLGVGIVQAKYEAEPEGIKVKSDALNGLAGQLIYLVVMPMSDSFDLTGGFTWTHMQFDVNEVKVGGTTVDVDKTVLINIPQIELGMRIRI